MLELRSYSVQLMELVLVILKLIESSHGAIYVLGSDISLKPDIGMVFSCLQEGEGYCRSYANPASFCICHTENQVKHMFVLKTTIFCCRGVGL